MHIRRVAFREGTDADLTALHAVEIPVELERGSNRMPQPVDAYIAFSRNLPAQFDDHTWLAESDDGTPLASGVCWSNAAGDADVMECDVLVHRDHRRRGIGTRLLAVICDATAAEGRGRLRWSSYSAVPAGDELSRQVGGRIARVNRTSEARLADVDWAMVGTWIREGPERAPGYQLQMVDGPFPPELHADAAAFHHIMQTAPRDDLDVGKAMLRVDDIAELDQALVEAGRRRWAIFVRDPAGRSVGGTEVTFEPWEPTTALQQNTGIHTDHRGLGLAKWAKAAILDRLRSEAPQIERVRTSNAFSNAPMLAINDALGFRVIATQTEWLADVADVQRALGISMKD